MKKHVTRTALAAAVVLMSVCLASQAFAWGSATHAYISDHLGNGNNRPVQNLNEIYGNMAGDVFNYLFDYPNWLDYLYKHTHYTIYGQPDFMRVWKIKTPTVLGRAAAFGFVSHNGQFGADLTAHGVYDYSTGVGYAIEKAVEMTGIQGIQDAKNFYHIEIDDTAFLELCHTFVESAVDIQLSKKHPDIGTKISMAAIARTPEFPAVLAKAFAPALAKLGGIDAPTAVGIIVKAENEFRKNMISYGLALQQADSIELVAAQLADLAPDFMRAWGVTLNLTHDDLRGLSLAFLQAAILITGDWENAVEDTIAVTAAGLQAYGIAY